VRHGTIEVGAAELPEGAKVTVLVPECDETFTLGPEDERRLQAAMQ
jgi:hypothetical protein